MSSPTGCSIEAGGGACPCGGPRSGCPTLPDTCRGCREAALVHSPGLRRRGDARSNTVRALKTSMEPISRKSGVPLPGLATLLMAVVTAAIGWTIWKSSESRQIEAEQARSRDAFRDPDASFPDRMRSIDLWVADGPAAIPHLLAELDNPHPSVRTSVLMALYRIQPGGDEAFAAMVQALDDSEAEVRATALTGLRAFCERDRMSLDAEIPQLIALLDDPDRVVRSDAFQLLSWHPADPQAYDTLPKIMASAAPDSRRLGARLIQQLRLDTPRCLAALRELTGDGDAIVRDVAFQALVACGDVTLEETIEALDSKDDPTRDLACSVLTYFGPEAVPAVDRLTELVRSRETVIPALMTLTAIGPAAEAAVPAVLELLDEPEAEDGVWRGLEARLAHALRCLAAISRADHVPVLRKFLNGSSRDVSRVAGEVLAARDPDAAAAEVPKLLERLKQAEETDPLPIITALGGIGPRAAPAVPVLVESIGEDGPIGYYALETLARIGPAAREALPALVVELRKLLDASDSEPEIARPEILLLCIRHIGEPSDELERVISALIARNFATWTQSDQVIGSSWVLSAAVRALAVAGRRSEAAHRQLRELYDSLDELEVALAAAPADPMSGMPSAAIVRDLRRAVLEALADVRVRVPETVDVLLDVARDEPDLTAVAIRCLGSCPEEAERTVPELMRFLDGEPEERVAAALALGELGGAARPALPVLRRIAADSENRLPASVSVPSPEEILSDPVNDRPLLFVKLSLGQVAATAIRRIETAE